jgi:hypothetical protein
MPDKKTKHFKIESKIGTSNASTVSLSKGGSGQHEVIVTPLGGVPKPTKLSCIRSSGTVAGYDPAPPDAWDHDFGSIDCSTAANLRTANRTVQAGQATGSAVFQVKELEVDDGLPPPRKDPIGLNVDVTVS